MSKCRYGKAALLYPNGMLSPAEKKRFEKHLSACAECRAAVENEMEIRSLYAEAAPAAPSAGFDERILRNLRATPPRPSPTRDWGNAIFARRLIPVAACISILMLIAVMFIPQSSSRQTAAKSSYYYYVAQSTGSGGGNSSSSNSLLYSNYYDLYAER